MSEAKTRDNVAPQPPPSEHVQKRPRTPAWHRHYLRRLAIHGNKERAAKESGISRRQADRVERAKPRFARAVRHAQRIALQAHSERMQSRMMDIAENGYSTPVVSGGKFVMNARKYVPNLMKMVAEVTVPMFRDAAERRWAKREHSGGVTNVNYAPGSLNYSVSQITNLASVDLAGESLSPRVREALCMLADALTASEQARKPLELDVTPPIVVRTDDE